MLARTLHNHLVLRHSSDATKALWSASWTKPLPHLPFDPLRSWSSINKPSFFLERAKQHTPRTTDVERISDLLEHFQLKKWGFVVYRCTYGDDETWSRFIDALNEQIDSIVRQKYGRQDLASRVDWRVQEHSAGLEAVTKDEIRRRFRRLVSSSLMPEESSEAEVSPAAEGENPRWNFCVHVDAASLDSVVHQGSGPVMTPNRYARPSERLGYVNLIRADRGWDYPDFDVFDWASRDSKPREGNAKADEEAEEDEYDEGQPEIEGSRMEDVGWMRVSVNDLLPSLYSDLISDHLWDYMYLRPPNIMRI